MSYTVLTTKQRDLLVANLAKSAALITASVAMLGATIDNAPAQDDAPAKKKPGRPRKAKAEKPEPSDTGILG